MTALRGAAGVFFRRAPTDTTDIRWALRVNVSHHNRPGMDDLVEQLAERLDPAHCTLYFARVGDVGVGYTNELHHEGDLARDFLRWYTRAIELGFPVQRPGPELPCNTCSFADGKFGAVINADGVLSSCWETAGHPGWEVGTLAEGYLPAAQTAERWVSCADLYRHDETQTARAAFQNRVDAGLLDLLHAKGRLANGRL